MPRYEIEDGDVTKFWEVTRDGTTFTAKWGKVGGSVSQRVYKYDDEDEADKEYEKHVNERLKKGYELVGGDDDDDEAPKAKKGKGGGGKAKAASNPELEAAIAKNPDDADAYLVYADWLTEQGDPRGELITLQHAMSKKKDAKDLKKKEKDLLEKHGDALLGSLAAHMAAGDYGRPAVEVEWHLGFLRAARLASTEEVQLSELYKELVAHPSGRFLRKLAFGVAVVDDSNDYSEVIDALEAAKAPTTVEELFIADCTSEESELSWCEVGDIGSCWKRFPNLKHLHIKGGSFDVGDLSKLSKLETLRITTGGLDKGNLKAIASVKFPQLTSLRLYFGQERYGASCGVKDLATILSGTNLPEVTELGLMNCEFIDELVATLPKAKILKQLTTLDLSLGTMTDDGAAMLAKGADALAHLALLNVAENYLTAAGVKAVKKLAKKVDAGSQREPYTGSDGTVYRYSAVGE